jgi:hypothetical protein
MHLANATGFHRHDRRCNLRRRREVSRISSDQLGAGQPMGTGHDVPSDVGRHLNGITRRHFVSNTPNLGDVDIADQLKGAHLHLFNSHYSACFT